MFERFSDRARRVVVLAQEEARMLGHNYIGTEHLLLGLIHEREGVAAQALDSLGIRLDAARAKVGAVVGAGTQQLSGHIPFTPQAKHVLEQALREALDLRSDHIGTEHLLLGIYRIGDSRAAEVLVAMGADMNEVRERVLQVQRRLQHIGSQPERGPGNGGDLGARRFAGRGPGGTTNITIYSPQRASSSMITDVSMIESMNIRLAAVEQWSGIVPDLAELDQAIVRTQHDKELAIDRQDFVIAAELRGTEKELLEQRERRAREWTEGPSLADEVAELRAEVQRLRTILRERGIEAGDKPA